MSGILPPEYRPYLTASDPQLRERFFALSSREDVAAILEVPLPFLTWVLFHRRERERYHEISLPKKGGGERRICIPPKNLRILQDKLLRVLTLAYSPRPCVTAFTPSRSVMTNAARHVGQRIIVTFDLEDFFPSIHLGRVAGTLKSGIFSLGREAAVTIAQIATHADGHLPQGSPTSPILANIVCGPLDTAMLQLARQHRLRYTRYADDITLSSTRRTMPEAIARIDEAGVCHLGEALTSTLAQHHFSVRVGKTRLRTSRRRQVVTGLVVNEFPNVPRSLLRELRSVLHSCSTKGVEEAAATYAAKVRRMAGQDGGAWLRSVVTGKLAYVRMVRGEHDPTYLRLLRSANELPWGPVGPIPALRELSEQPIRRRSRTSPNWPLWVDRYRSSIFRIKCTDKTRPRENFGTAFRIGSASFLTAGHNAAFRGEGDGTLLERDIDLMLLPFFESVRASTIHFRFERHSGVDIATFKASLPEEWPAVVIPTQERLPELGEEVAALGFPEVAYRRPTLVLHVGRVESVPVGYLKARFITVSFATGPGLSGSPLFDANGYCLGVMVENTFMAGEAEPKRAYGQALAIGHWREIPERGRSFSRAAED